MFNFETKFRSSNTSREQLIRQVNRLTKIHPRFLSLFTLGIVNGADSYLSTSRDPPSSPSSSSPLSAARNSFNIESCSFAEGRRGGEDILIFNRGEEGEGKFKV